MEYEEVKALRERWGGKPCDHPDFTDEYLFGSKTGDFVCTQCGESFTKRQRDQMNRKGANPKLVQFTEQNKMLKERIDILAARRDRLDALANAADGHSDLDATLLEQLCLIKFLDELIQSTD
ncbi:hypothetical protein [Porticoccus sp.]